ncbi:MAG: hypothetical protein ACI8U3_001028 [Brevundimonas sp.]|jgi:hypothetical protein|uniref:hypothetical protein n=1 Tax=Brevundimonas sp. TaxID=1871086 RepID=UPI0039E54A68
MIGAGAIWPWLTALVIAAAVLAGVIRLWLWRRASQAEAPAWRLPALVGLQLTAAALLWLTLNPPTAVTSGSALRVLTGGDAEQTPAPGEILVALPEAGAPPGATRVPDLAAALRRFPEAQSVRVSGAGLPPRDHGPLPVPLTYEPGPAPVGVVELTLPRPVAPGAGFEVGGRADALSSGTVELVDPADQVIDRADVRAGDRFTLAATARASGLALFHLRLRDGAGDLIEDIAVPVETRDPTEVRMMLLAGAPGPEVRQVRRWAESADLDVNLQVDLGAGVRLGGAAPLTAAALGDLDLLVIDDRRWQGLPAASRSAITSAVRGGMGLLLRPTGPLDGATRNQWAALGAALSGSGDAVAPPEGAEALTRLDFVHDGRGTVPALRDEDGQTTASWSGMGLGRVGVITLADTYTLALTGRSDAHSRIWASMVSALARPAEDGRPEAGGMAWAGQRTAVCGLEDEGRVVAPSGQERRLVIDPAAGGGRCAAYWPEAEGWHVALDSRDRQAPFYVHLSDAAPSLVRAANRRATLDMAAATPDAEARAQRREAGSPWPWFLGLLVVLALLWWLERRRRKTET